MKTIIESARPAYRSNGTIRGSSRVVLRLIFPAPCRVYVSTLSTCLSAHFPRQRDKYLLFKIPVLVARGPQDKLFMRRRGWKPCERERGREKRGVDYKPKAADGRGEGAAGKKEGGGWWSVQQQQQQPRRSTVRVVYGGLYRVLLYK